MKGIQTSAVKGGMQKGGMTPWPGLMALAGQILQFENTTRLRYSIETWWKKENERDIPRENPPKVGLEDKHRLLVATHDFANTTKIKYLYSNRVTSRQSKG
jgi:hypothetical protein